ncbi:MAG: transpeptidase family protein [Candidatus Hydrogenedentes bacterium]|nr:transpeptidase family protein [Candidatus Hydrogenedentota bacterium]
MLYTQSQPLPADTDLPPSLGHRVRIRFVFWGFLAVFFILAIHITKLQIWPDEKFLKNDEAHVGEVPLTIPRGRIYDRGGRILARDRQAPSIWANPQYIEDPYDAAQRLSVRLNLGEDQVLERLTRRTPEGEKLVDVPIKRYLTESEFAALGDLNAFVGGGLRIKREPVRYYPEEGLAAHVLGYVNREHEGTEGIEGLYDPFMRNIQGWHKSRVDARRNLLSSLTLEYVPPAGGDDVFLTIDKPIQHALERELLAVMERCQAARATGMLMDPKTGAILALACMPAFDPNVYWEYTPEQRKNRAVIDVFEPGSAFKIVTASAALEHGLITPDTLINCEGGRWSAFGRRLISDVHKMQTVPFREAFAESSNICIIKVADKIIKLGGNALLDEWIQRFGFGQKTSRDFLMESPGIYRAAKHWSKLSVISLPMGQEVAVTMPQLARAFAVIANGGFLVEPHLVEYAKNRHGQETYRFVPKDAPRVLSEQTAAVMRELCYEVIAHGTGTRAAIPEYRAGGKTGTAQVARADGRGYYEDQHTAVLAGFAPISDPRVVAVIVVHNPQSKPYWGGYVCGPVFKEVVREALIRLECPEEPMEGVEEPGLEEEDADMLVAREGDSGPHTQEYVVPSLLSLLDSGAELLPTLADLPSAAPRLPSFQGMTKREAREALIALGVAWDVQGSGWVVAQEPPPGTLLNEVTECRLVFSNNRRTETQHDPAGPAETAT